MNKAWCLFLPLLMVALSGCSVAPTQSQLKKSGADAVPVSFPADFDVPIDSAGFGEGKPIHGWAGSGPVERNPVIFIHGNGTDSDMFRGYAQVFHERYGYNYSELWSFSYQGYPYRLPENKQSHITTPHKNGVDDVHAMVERVLAYTGRSQVTLVTYSLGSTLGLHYLKKYDAYDRVDTFVSIVGANHGFKGAEEGGEPEWTPEAIRALCVHSSGDETPYGRNTQELVHIPPDDHRAINWIVLHAGQDDYMLNMHLKTWQQVDNHLTSELAGADLNQSFEGVFNQLEKPFGAHISFIFEMEKMFPIIDPWFLP